MAALAVLGVGDIAAILRAEAYLVAESCISDVLRHRNDFTCMVAALDVRLQSSM